MTSLKSNLKATHMLITSKASKDQDLMMLFQCRSIKHKSLANFDLFNSFNSNNYT